MGPDRRRRRGFGRRPAAPEAPADPEAARLTGIGLLARRDYPRQALRARLIDRGYEPEAAEGAVERLADERLVDDERLVGHRIAGRIARGHGPLRIRLELERDGLARELIDAALKALEVDWAAQAAATLRRRYGATVAPDATERAARARFLYYRGYSGDHVRAALSAGAGEAGVEDAALDDGGDLAGALGDDVDL